MATSITYTGNGTQTLFTFPFDYLSQSFIQVTVDGLPVPFTLHSAYTVNITTAPTATAAIRIRRVTARDRLVVYDNGSILLATDLNTAQIQLLHIVEEAFDLANGSTAASDEALAALVATLAARDQVVALLAGITPGGGSAASANGEVVLVVPDYLDATDLIANALGLMQIAGGGKLIVKRANINDPIKIAKRIQWRGSDIDLQFVSPIHYDSNGSIRATGDIDEYWRGAVDVVSGLRVENTGGVPAIATDSTNAAGSGFLELSFGTVNDYVGQFSVGDLVVVRGYISAVSLSAIEIQTGVITSINTGTGKITLDVPRAVHTDADEAAEMGKNVGDPFTFRSRYYAPGAPEIPANELASPFNAEGAMSTRVKVVRTSLMPADEAGGTHFVSVANGSLFATGDLVYVSDDRREVDIDPQRTFTNPVNMEIAKVAAVVGNVLTLEAPLRRSYVTAYRARVSKILPITNSHMAFRSIKWIGIQPNFVTNAIQFEFGLGCTVRLKKMIGYGGKVGHGIRLSNSYDCHAIGGNMTGSYSFGAGEAYGASIYYSTMCSIQDMTISGMRHAILFAATTHCKAKGNRVTNSYINGIDCHGMSCVASVIEENYIRGGWLYSPDASTHAGIRVGNASHVITDRDTVIRGNVIEGLIDANDAAIDFAGPSKGIQVIGNIVRDCTWGIQNTGNNALNTVRSLVDDVLIKGNTFTRVANPVKLYGQASGGVLNVLIDGNTTIRCPKHFRAWAAEAPVIFVNNTVVTPTVPANPMFDLKDCSSVTVTGNTSIGLDVGAKVDTCAIATVVQNQFFGAATPVNPVGTNPVTVFADNSGTGGTAAEVKKYPAGLSTGFTITSVIPTNNTSPVNTDGTQVMSVTLPTKLGENYEVDVVFPYVELTGTTGNVTAHVFNGSTAIATVSERITNSSGNTMRTAVLVAGTGSNVTLTVRMGLAVTGSSILLNNRFNGLSDPYLLVTRFAA